MAEFALRSHCDEVVFAPNAANSEYKPAVATAEQRVAMLTERCAELDLHKVYCQGSLQHLPRSMCLCHGYWLLLRS